LEFFNKKNQPPDNKPKEFWRIRTWFPDIPEETEQKLKLFNTELLKFNNSLSLVSDKTLTFSDVIHFSDSILGAREIIKDAQPSSIIDVGSGNGFPGLVLGILYPNIKVQIIEKDPRKIEFLRNVTSALNLNNIDFQINAIEGIQAGSLNFVVMRSSLAISKAILLLRKQVKKGGVLYMMKSEEWATEVANIPSQLCTYWTPSLVGEYRLPVGEVKFAVVKLKKIAD
jgi:16S rRNA (guanine527-N7)-methyltransferase